MVYEDEVRDVSVQTCCTSPLMNIPDIQEIATAMVAYGKNVPRAPPARLFSSSGHVLENMLGLRKRGILKGMVRLA